MVRRDEIPTSVLSSDLPESFTGKVNKVEEALTKEGGKSITLDTTITSNTDVTLYKDGKAYTESVKGKPTNIMYRIPKTITGKGQGDILFNCMEKMGIVDTKELANKEFVFNRIALRSINPKMPVSFQEIPRHYPVSIVQQSL